MESPVDERGRSRRQGVDALLGEKDRVACCFGELLDAGCHVDGVTDEGLVIRDVWLLRLRALLARAQGDAAAHTHFRDRYRDMAKTLGFEGHIAWAEAMP